MSWNKSSVEWASNLYDVSRSRACDRLAERLKVARAGYRGYQQRDRGGDVRRSEEGTRTWETICMEERRWRCGASAR